MKLRHPIPYTILTVAAAVAFASWTAGMDRMMTADRQFARLLNGTPRQVIETVDAGMVIPPRARSRSRFADIMTEELFPPPYDRAFEQIEQALPLRPLDSALWVQAARFQLFRGNADQARAALNVSDQIDPRYPTQRIQAIRLWGLLNDQERAIQIARNVARLGSPFREQAAGELAAIGVAPRDIFEIVAATGLESTELYEVTRSIIDSDPSRVEETIRELPTEVVREPEFRRQLAVLLERTRRFEILLILWEMDGAELTEPVPGLIVDNTNLSLPPRAGTFPLGWRNPVNVADVNVRWAAPTGGAANTIPAALEFSIGPEAGRRVHWPVYRAVVPANTPVRVSVQLRQDPFFGGTVTLRGRAPGHLIHGPTTDPSVSGWVTLSVTMPPLPQPEILNIELDWVRRGLDDEGQRTTLFIQSITFEAPQGAGGQ